MQALETGRLRARLAEGPQDVARAQRLRQRCFRGEEPGLDADGHDAACQHVLVETPDGTLLSCYRLQVIAGPEGLEQSYSAQFYDLAPLAGLPAPMIEMGRRAVHNILGFDGTIKRELLPLELVVRESTAAPRA